MPKSPSIRTVLLQPAFLACVLVLSLGVIGTSAIERALGICLTKQPLLLQRPFVEMDQKKLAPFTVIESFRIEDPELEKSLGATDYLQWVLADTRRSPRDPLREVLLFITYYALPDKIPHVPEECYLGSGFQRLLSERVHFSLNSETSAREVPGRVLVFARAGTEVWGQTQRVPVLYLFHVNGQYAPSREEARVALNQNLFGKGSYFSKVELVFNRSSGAVDSVQAQGVAQEVLSLLLPLLEQDFWPAWPPDAHAFVKAEETNKSL